MNISKRTNVSLPAHPTRNMPPLKFCANLSWLFTDLPEFTQRIYAAASAGFQAVEAAWLYDSDLQELQRVKNATGVDVVLINTPLGKTEKGYWCSQLAIIMC